MTDTTDHPSRRAGLRDELVKALGRIKTTPPVAHCREQADHVLAVLYREWPWLRAEAEDAAAVSVPAADRAAEEPCSQFPDACPNLRPVLPDPPHHDGGVRCACGEERYKAGQLRAAVLREAVRRIEDGEPLPDRDLRFRRGADWVLDALRRQAAEAAVPAVGVAADTTGSCAHCGKPVRQVTGTLAAWWVHDPEGHALCRPLQPNSTRAEPGPMVPAQPGNDTKAPQHAPGTAICCPDCRAKGHAVCAADKAPVVAYRSHSGSLLRCLTHAPDQTALDGGAFHPVTAGDLPDGGVCTYRAPGVECGVDVLNPQQP